MEANATLLMVTVDGVAIGVWVQKLTADSALLDANLPLAGESLIVEVEILSAYSEADTTAPPQSVASAASEYALEF